jgi:replicative DNA helicase
LTNAEIHDSYVVALSLMNESPVSFRLAMARQWVQLHGNRPIPEEIWTKASESVPSAGNWGYYHQGLIETFQRRRLRDAGLKLANDVSDATKPVVKITAQLEAFIAENTNTRSVSVSSRDVLKSLTDQMKAASERRKNGQLSGIKTGFREFDKMTDGLQFGELALIAARPSIGKTAMGLNIAREAALGQGIATFFLTAEMPPDALMRRIIADVGNIPMGRLKAGDLNDAEQRRYAIAQDRISKAPLHFHDVIATKSGGEAVAAIRSAVRKYGIKLVVVDYLQKLRPDGTYEKRTYEVAEVSGALKACAVSTGVAMLCLAQVNRDSEKGDPEKSRCPSLADLAESGQLERDADLVGLLHRDRNDPEIKPRLIIAKARDGETGRLYLEFDGVHQRFTDPTPDIRPEDCLP